MPTQTSGLRELAERVFTASPGDSLGLRYDFEAQLLLIEGIVERFSQSLASEHLSQWRALIEGLEGDFDIPKQPSDLRARYHTHRLMLETATKLMAMRRRDEVGDGIAQQPSTQGGGPPKSTPNRE